MKVTLDGSEEWCPLHEGEMSTPEEWSPLQVRSSAPEKQASLLYHVLEACDE